MMKGGDENEKMKGMRTRDEGTWKESWMRRGKITTRKKVTWKREGKKCKEANAEEKTMRSRTERR